MSPSCSVPFLGKEKIADIPMLDAVSTHIKFIEGNNIFRKVVANAVICTELTADCFFRGIKFTSYDR